MLEIKKLSFNHFGVNTYVVWDDTKECVLVDVACNSKEEQDYFQKFIKDNELKPVKIVLTHAHLDHIPGIYFACTTYNLPVCLHEDGLFFLKDALISGPAMGFHFLETELNALKKEFIKGGQDIAFGNSSLKVLETPGHAAGSLCYLSTDPFFVITGDVLFKQSIGRTDLITGNLDVLLNAIKTQLLVLPDDTKVFPGHGPSSTIIDEKYYNPFLTSFQE